MSSNLMMSKLISIQDAYRTRHGVEPNEIRMNRSHYIALVKEGMDFGLIRTAPLTLRAKTAAGLDYIVEDGVKRISARYNKDREPGYHTKRIHGNRITLQ